VYTTGVLDGPEHFFLALSTIPWLSERLQCWHFTMTFDDKFKKIESPLAHIKAACQQIRGSKALKEIFAIILTLGNYMNGGNPALGQADGFQLEALPKLAETRDNSSRSNLLRYVVYLVKKKDAQQQQGHESLIATLISDLPDLEKACTTPLEQVSKELKELGDKCAQVTSLSIGVLDSLFLPGGQVAIALEKGNPTFSTLPPLSLSLIP